MSLIRWITTGILYGSIPFWFGTLSFAKPTHSPILIGQNSPLLLVNFSDGHHLWCKLPRQSGVGSVEDLFGYEYCFSFLKASNDVIGILFSPHTGFGATCLAGQVDKRVNTITGKAVGIENELTERPDEDYDPGTYESDFVKIRGTRATDVRSLADILGSGWSARFIYDYYELNLESFAPVSKPNPMNYEIVEPTTIFGDSNCLALKNQ